MKLVPVEETFKLVEECFPEVDCSDFIAFRDRCIAFKQGEDGFFMACPYSTGIILQYLGVSEARRGQGVASAMVSFLMTLADRPVYAECVRDSPMYRHLTGRGWYHVPIAYTCPAWGNEPADPSRDLLCSDPAADHLTFITEFYRHGYKTSDTQLLRRYDAQLHAVLYTPEYQASFLALFSQCFEDDPETILESIDRAQLRLLVYDGQVKGFMLYHHYPDIDAIAVEYVGVSADMRGRSCGHALFDLLEDQYPTAAMFGECRPNTPVTAFLTRRGWEKAPIHWVCPAWGNIPQDTTRDLMCYRTTGQGILDFAQHYYDWGYGVDGDALVSQYRKELGLS